MIDHRGPEFAAILKEIMSGAREVFGTAAADILCHSSSGTGAMESAAANLLSPGDEVIVATAGVFGDRFGDIARAYGADVVRYEVEWGQPITPADLADLMEAHPRAQTVFLTHNETSTGMTNPLAELARVVRAADRLLVVDAISSASSMRVSMDDWGLDVVLSGSQKGWMAPPGVSFVAIGPRAWERQAQSRSPRFYFDWTTARTWAEKGFTPSTPAVSVFFAVQEGLTMLKEEGLENVFTRHRRLADATAAGLEAAGLRLLAAEGYRSATVTAGVVPDGVDVEKLRTLLRTKYGVVIAGGRGAAKISERIIRVGHLGAVSAADIATVLWAVEQGLEELDHAPADGRSLNAAQPFLSETQKVGAG